MRLIDADALKVYCKEGLIDVLPRIKTDKYKDIAIQVTGDFCRDIDEQPTVQAVPIEVLQEIRQEIEKPLRDERCFDTADAKAQYIALNWVCELIDKHIKEIEE